MTHNVRIVRWINQSSLHVYDHPVVADMQERGENNDRQLYNRHTRNGSNASINPESGIMVRWFPLDLVLLARDYLVEAGSQTSLLCGSVDEGVVQAPQSLPGDSLEGPWPQTDAFGPHLKLHHVIHADGSL